MTDSENKKIGSALASIRMAHGLSVSETAKKIAITPGQLTRIEKGLSVPYERTRVNIKKVFPESGSHLKEYRSRALKPTRPGSFGEFLRELRIERGFSIIDVVDATDIDQSMLSSYELSRSQPSMRHLKSLMSELGFTPENPEQVATNRGRPKTTH